MTDARTPTPTPKRRTLAGVIGTALGAAALFTVTPFFESGRTVDVAMLPEGDVDIRHVAGRQYLEAYLDIVRVPTACDGITKGIRLGQRYTEAQCTAMLERELIAHAEEVIACVPQLYGREREAPAAVSLAYNIGGPRFCASTAARHFRAKRWTEGCNALTMWIKAGGRVVQGLVNRRERERAICLRGFTPRKDLP
nr:lysozyme [uncultured Sphingomonas sp.]